MEWGWGKSGSRRNESRKIDLDNVANVTLFIAVFIGIWQIVFLLNVWPKVALPSPAMVSSSFEGLIQDRTLIDGIAVTMYRLIIGFSISIIVGIVIGLAMVKFSGFGKTMSSVFSVMMSTYSGVRNIPHIYIRAARNMGAKGFSLFWYLMIPAATPSLLIGLKQAWSFAWHALIGAEILIAASVGLGHVLLVGREFQLMDQIIASMITIFVIGLIFDRLLFSKLEDRVREKWGLNQTTEH